MDPAAAAVELLINSWPAAFPMTCPKTASQAPDTDATPETDADAFPRVEPNAEEMSSEPEADPDRGPNVAANDEEMLGQVDVAGMTDVTEPKVLSNDEVMASLPLAAWTMGSIEADRLPSTREDPEIEAETAGSVDALVPVTVPVPDAVGTIGLRTTDKDPERLIAPVEPADTMPREATLEHATISCPDAASCIA